MTAPPLSPPRVPPAPVAAPRRRIRGTLLLPYALLAPAIGTLALVLAYPLIKLIVLSMQKFGLPQQFGAPADFVGLDNFRRIFNDPNFWAVLIRTVFFTAVTVGFTMVIGTLLALLLQRVHAVIRLGMLTMLLLVWAMPPVSSTVVWQWMFDSQYGVINWVLTALGFDFHGHSWLSNPHSFFAVVSIVVIWMGIPFVTFTVFAGLTQVPGEVLEAAQLDGANGFQRLRHVIVPYLKPVLLILTTLSTLWNFQLVNQVYVLQQAGGISSDTNILGVYAYRVAIGQSRFGLGAAIAVVMVVLTLLLTVFYLRQMTKQEDQ